MSQPNDDYRSIPGYILYLIATGVCVAVGVVLLLVQAAGGPYVLHGGVYVGLVATACATFVGYLVRSEGYRVSRRQDVALAELRKLAPREPHRPTLGRCRVYTARPDLGDTITLPAVRIPPVGLDAESIQAARSIARDLLKQKRP